MTTPAPPAPPTPEDPPTVELGPPETVNAPIVTPAAPR